MRIELTARRISPSNPTKVALSVKNAEDETLLETEQVDLSRTDKRKAFCEQLIKNYPGLDIDDVNERLLKITDDLLSRSEKPDDETEEPIETPLVLSEKALAKTDEKLIEVAKDFLKNPKLVDGILRHIEYLGVVGERPLSLALYLILTSRLLSRPLAGIVLGTSSSGKSKIIKTTAELFPDEAVFSTHRLTPTALQYLPAGTLVHRAVVAGERSRKLEDEAAEATRALREMISDGHLSVAVTGRDEEGNLKTHHITQPGPISYVESTTLGGGEIFDEDKTRFLLLCCDESEEQSRAVMARFADDASSPKQKDKDDSLIALHHTAQRLLRPKEVIIPYAPDLVSAIPCTRPESRRAFDHLLNLIRACALLHQYQRPTDDEGRILADVADYEIVREHLTEAIGRGLGVVLSAGAENLMEVIENNFGVGDRFTANDLKEKSGLGRIVYDRLRELRQYHFVRIAEPGAGSVGAKYEINPMFEAVSGLELPPIKKRSILPGGNAHTNFVTLFNETT